MVKWSELKQIRERLEMKTAPRLLEQPVMEARRLYTSVAAVDVRGREWGQGIAKWELRGLVISVRHGLRMKVVIKK